MPFCHCLQSSLYPSPKPARAAAGALVSGPHELCTCQSLVQPGTPANWADLGCTLSWAELGSLGQELQGQCKQKEEDLGVSYAVSSEKPKQE